jgi:Mn2+/Fe2+ NRAMP family transporter
MEENQMQSIDELKQWKQFFSMKENATPATRRDRPRATRKAAIETWAASGVFILLFVASVAYVAFGGTLATEPSPPPEAAAAAAAVTAGLGDAGGALRNESVSITVEEGTQ